MKCSACQQENEPGFQNCNRCGASADRGMPPLFFIEAALTGEAVWGLSLAVLILPLALLGIGIFAAWVIWGGVGLSSYWSLTGLAVLLPGIIFTLTIFPAFRRVRSFLMGLGLFTVFGLMAAGIAGLLVAIYLFLASTE